MGKPKQLLPFRGATLVRAVAAEACASTCARVAVVVGAYAARVVEALDGLPVAIVPNGGWSEGLAASIRAAATWAQRADYDALVLAACDQPHLAAEHVDRLIAHHRERGGAVASHYAGAAGVPALFPARDFPKLLALAGDVGARHVLASAQPELVDWPPGACDVDTPRVARLVLGIDP